MHRPLLATTKLIDNLERHRLISDFSESEWLDHLQISWKDYALVRSGIKKLPQNSLDILADDLGVSSYNFGLSNFDFHEFQIKMDQGRWQMPRRYNFAMHGRCRTTITSFDYLEKRFGWRLRFEVLKNFSMSEFALSNAFAPISMQFITDVCDYLSKERHFEPADFYMMGFHSYHGNRNSILGSTLQSYSNVPQVLQHMWGDLLPLLEQNCSYRFIELAEKRALIEVTSSADVADELGVKHLGNPHICNLKAGMMAAAPCYINRAAAQVVERSCVHRGDSCCIFEINY